MHIEQLEPELEHIVSVDQPVEELATGFGNSNGPAEGPLWWQEGGYLLFNDIGNDRRIKWTSEEGISVFKQPTSHSNGMTRDPQGRLVVCERVGRVCRFEHDGSPTVVAGNYQGRRLNWPNDLVVKSDGSIYFTDPSAPTPGYQLDFCGVYRVSPDLGTMTLLVRDFVFPNGLAFSHDERILYINDSRRGHIRAFDVQANGTLALASDRVFCDVNGDRPGLPDGIKVDIEGNVYCGGSGGIWIIDSTGKHQGTIVNDAPLTTNLAWGGGDWKTLFYTTRYSLGRVQMKVPGVPVPAPVPAAR